MKKVIFAKIFEVKKGQVLVTKSFDDSEDSPYILKISTELSNGANMTASAGYDSEYERDAQFVDYSQKQADAFAASMYEIFKN